MVQRGRRKKNSSKGLFEGFGFKLSACKLLDAELLPALFFFFNEQHNADAAL